MFEIVFVIMTLIGGQPAIIGMPETTKFKDAAACEAFGEKMVPRVQDYTRGGIQAIEWDHPVEVKWQCEATGDPA
jgi:hypothetical protein